MENNTLKRLQVSKALAYQLRTKITSGQVLTEDEVNQCIDKLDYMNRLVENAILTEEEKEDLENEKEETAVKGDNKDSLSDITLIGRSITDDGDLEDDDEGEELETLESFKSGEVIERFKDSEEDVIKEETKEHDPYRMVQGEEKEKSWFKKTIDKLFN